MKAWTKSVLVIGLLVLLNIAIGPSLFRQSFINSGPNLGLIGNTTLRTAENESVLAIGADYVWTHLKDKDGAPITGQSKIIGIIDTGIDYRHPDFFLPNWSARYPLVSTMLMTWSADLNRNGSAEPGESLFFIDSVDGPAGWKAEYDWLFLDRNVNGNFDYGTDCYVLPMDEDGNGDLNLGETVVLLTESKILAIIDMTTGQNWTRAQIEAGTAATYDMDGHGTNVAGIAAGGQLKQDGAPFHRFTGVAPGANLIIVKIGNETKNLYTDYKLYQALWNLAKKGVDVISLSLGAYIWRHLDGTSALEQLIDNLNCSVVVAAGNLQNKYVHQEQYVAAGQISSVPFSVSPYYSEPNQIKISVIWNYTSVALDFNLTYYGPVGGFFPWPGPGPFPSFPFPFVSRVSLLNPNPALQTKIFPVIGTRVDYWLQTSSETRLLCINITSTIVPGTYSIEIFNSPINLIPQCYIWDNTNQFVNATYPFPPLSFPAWVLFGWQTGPVNPQIIITATPEYTVTHPATAENAISVGSYNLATGALSAFSSIGSKEYRSKMDGLEKPDLCGPGDDTKTQGINSSVSRNATGTDLSTWTSHINAYRGTSQATPHVAGTIALMLQKNGTLTAGEIKGILRKTAVNDSFVGVVPNYRWGFGKLNATAAVQEIILVPSAPFLQPPTNVGFTVYLNWTKKPAATIYYIYRSTSIIHNLTGLIPVGTSPTNSSTNLVSDYGIYYYVIVAGNSYGNSSFSNCEAITISPPGENYWWIYIILGAGAIILVAVIIIVRKKKKALVA